MTDPLHPTDPPADVPTPPVDAADTLTNGTPINGTPSTDTSSTGTSSTGTSSAGTTNDSDSLTPLYAAAGLAEVVMTSLRSRISRAQVQGLPANGKGRIAELQQQLRGYRDQITHGYASLATRGKPTVDSTLVTVRHLSGRAERKTEDLRQRPAPTVTSQAPTAPQDPSEVVEPIVVVETPETDRPGGMS